MPQSISLVHLQYIFINMRFQASSLPSFSSMSLSDGHSMKTYGSTISRDGPNKTSGNGTP